MHPTSLVTLLAAPILATVIGVAPGCGVFRRGGPAASVDAPARRPPPLPPKQRAEALVVSAESLIRRGDNEAALAELARAIEINPRFTRAHMTIADLHRMGGDYAAAEESYRSAAVLEPLNFDAQYYDGLMLHILDRVTDAIGAYLRALAIKPGDYGANIRLATAYYQLGENGQALEYAQRAVTIRPQSGEARFQLGAVLAAMNDHRGAVKEYQQAAELMPLTTGLLMNLSESLGKLERYTEMRNALEQVLRTDPSATAWERLGFADFRLGQFERAQKDFESGLRVDADYYPALNGLGVCLLNKWIASDKADNKVHDAGVQALRRSLQINRDQPKIVELLSRYAN
jgi:tetratricopeptide (TPR) repeat protein